MTVVIAAVVGAAVVGGLLGAFVMAIVAIRGYDRLEVENARLRRANRELLAAVNASIEAIGSGAVAIEDVNRRLDKVVGRQGRMQL